MVMTYKNALLTEDQKNDEYYIKKYTLPFNIYTCFTMDYFLYKYNNKYIGMFLVTEECEKCEKNKMTMYDQCKEKKEQQKYHIYETIDESDTYIKKWIEDCD
jgi:hypothetical protein